MKTKLLDLGIVHSDKICKAVGMFTTNKIRGEPLKIAKKHIRNNKIQTLIVNSKNANVCTGKEGYKKSMSLCQKISQELKVNIEDVFPSSTGVINFPLPVDNILNKLEGLSHKLSPATTDSFKNFAQAIMTTDTFPKYLSYKIGDATLLGVTKGSGMIEPNMATTLVYFFTDADIPFRKLNTFFKDSIQMSFNSLSIDSDMSTSDTALLLSNGYYKVDLKLFKETLHKMCLEFARWIVSDGEGVTQIFIVDVIDASSKKEAYKIGKSIINSPLVKTAFGKKPNLGRIFMAIGKSDIKSKIKPDKIQIYIGENKINSTHYEQIQKDLSSTSEIKITVDMGMGKSSWRVYGCNLTEDYIRINSDYIS